MLQLCVDLWVINLMGLTSNLISHMVQEQDQYGPVIFIAQGQNITYGSVHIVQIIILTAIIVQI